MKKICILLFLISGFTFAYNAEVLKPELNEPKVGDVLVINESSGNTYNHIFFPKLNFIVKRGGQATYKSVHGNYVIIKNVTKKENGDIYVVLEKKNGGKFFSYLKKVKANYTKSLNSGEMSLIRS
ncbi:hypothetical protein [Yeosuana sp.]|uniref:hypothetical protein n=1 Tax=Yeosuana sp. TaxID=2529388 RepID=UPI00405519C2|tara:strand:- start:6509 stop:6883 length:375 start_codon:yes stop_codon:yes gene_type:complete